MRAYIKFHERGFFEMAKAKIVRIHSKCVLDKAYEAELIADAKNCMDDFNKSIFDYTAMLERFEGKKTTDPQKIGELFAQNLTLQHKLFLFSQALGRLESSSEYAKFAVFYSHAAKAAGAADLVLESVIQDYYEAEDGFLDFAGDLLEYAEALDEQWFSCLDGKADQKAKDDLKAQEDELRKEMGICPMRVIEFSSVKKRGTEHLKH